MTMHVKQTPKVMFWGCMSIFGVGRLHIVEGIMNAAKYNTVLRNRMVPQAAEWFPQGYIYQQGNAPSTHPVW